MRDKTKQMISAGNVSAEVFAAKESDLESKNSFSVLQNAIGNTMTGAMVVAVVVAGKVIEHGPIVINALASMSHSSLATAAAYVALDGTGVALLEKGVSLLRDDEADNEFSPK